MNQIKREPEAFLSLRRGHGEERERERLSAPSLISSSHENKSRYQNWQGRGGGTRTRTHSSREQRQTLSKPQGPRIENGKTRISISPPFFHIPRSRPRGGNEMRDLRNERINNRDFPSSQYREQRTYVAPSNFTVY